MLFKPTFEYCDDHLRELQREEEFEDRERRERASVNCNWVIGLRVIAYWVDEKRGKGLDWWFV